MKESLHRPILVVNNPSGAKARSGCSPLSRQIKSCPDAAWTCAEVLESRRLPACEVGLDRLIDRKWDRRSHRLVAGFVTRGEDCNDGVVPGCQHGVFLNRD